MHPAEEKARLDMVREGLKKFALALPLTLREVFGDASPKYRNMERKVLSGLVDLGIVESITAGTVGQPTRYVLKNAQELVRIVESDVELADIIWPGSKVPEVPPEPEEQEQVSEEIEPIVEPPPFAPPTDLPPMSLEDKVDRMIVLFTAAMESLIYMRDKIDTMEKKVDRLYGDLTGEKK